MSADQAAVGAFVVGALAMLAAFSKFMWPRLARFFRSLDRMFETINGRPPELDKAGRQVSEAVPSLSVQLADLRKDVKDQANQNARITHIEGIVADHSSRLERIEAGSQMERLVGKVESAQAWRAVEAIANNGNNEDPDTE